jgi:hypothetical protein
MGEPGKTNQVSASNIFYTSHFLYILYCIIILCVAQLYLDKYLCILFICQTGRLANFFSSNFEILILICELADFTGFNEETGLAVNIL